MFHTIVVGVDGRAGGRAALDLAARLAIPGESDVVAVRAVRREAYPDHLGDAPHGRVPSSTPRCGPATSAAFAGE